MGSRAAAYATIVGLTTSHSVARARMCGGSRLNARLYHRNACCNAGKPSRAASLRAELRLQAFAPSHAPINGSAKLSGCRPLHAPIHCTGGRHRESCRAQSANFAGTYPDVPAKFCLLGNRGGAEGSASVRALFRQHHSFSQCRAECARHVLSLQNGPREAGRKSRCRCRGCCR